MKKYRVIFLDLLESKEHFELGMSNLGVSPTTIERILHKAPVVLKADMPLGDARQYADAVLNAGGKVNIQEDGLLEETEHMNRTLDITPLENFTMCPECGFKQLKAARCVKCGLVFEEGKPD